ncbi:hypothetical protein HYPSUDRAFT_64361 [Hypholoma sublateritium FD-334 SS-4]|uniref:Uncharacterized protein n=1 Tax=Hypholoma sublateritium (strain FD-334 SS-4) TaxID=945553 RepID=A0A0D2LF27_HYPSF|nr:hypothetical protein HYPSUDRAFT_64361 [Hypholoma sublateritium FD-334 SS-4]
MEFAVCSIPQISISPAPPEDRSPEPRSPFRSLTAPALDDAFRPMHLTPPPTSTIFKRPRSPLVDPAVAGRGLARDRFESLLSAARGAGKRDLDLRKEIALKTHKNKQVERRALFLSKLQAPPSPSAATTPKTPPESPAIFHYRLPSPGLVSPLALFEALGSAEEGIPDGWVEQVDFRRKAQPPAVVAAPRGVPSLDQISARFTPQKADANAYPGLAPVSAPTVRPSVGVGRLRMPLRAPPPPPPPQPAANQQHPVSPRVPAQPEIRVTTLVVPHTRSAPVVQLTEQNLCAFNCQAATRGQRADAMLSALRRRTRSAESVFARAGADAGAKAEVDYKWRRRSAPADIMPLRARGGFEHPVLALPGGF